MYAEYESIGYLRDRDLLPDIINTSSNSQPSVLIDDDFSGCGLSDPVHAIVRSIVTDLLGQSV